MNKLYTIRKVFMIFPSFPKAQLGFIDKSALRLFQKHVLHPGDSKQWLRAADIIHIFSSVQQHWNKTDAAVFVSLIENYAEKVLLRNQTRETQSISAVNSGDSVSKVDLSSAAKECDATNIHQWPPVTKGAGLVNTYWVKEYLEFLRRQGRNSWKKEQKEKLAVETKKLNEYYAFEFRKSLAGLYTQLSEAQINELLMQYELLSPEDLANVIDLRVNSWRWDADGRGDFAHNLRRRIEKYDHEVRVQQRSKGDCPAAQNISQTVLVLWKALDKTTREIKRSEFIKELVVKHKEDLLKSENTEAAITRDLFWKYFKKCPRTVTQPSTQNFGDWLRNYVDQGNRALNEFKLDFKHRLLEGAMHASRSKSVTPLIGIVESMEKVASSLPRDNAIEVRKGLVALRRDDSIMTCACGAGLSGSAARKNKAKKCKCCLKSDLSHSMLVSKETFEKHFLNILDPRLFQLPKETHDIKKVVAEARTRLHRLSSKEDAKVQDLIGDAEFEDVFVPSQDVALEKALSLAAKAKREKKEAFEEWKRKKDDEKKLETEEKVVK